MSNNSLKYFLFEYIRSLKERTRLEKTGFKNGLDWLIYQLGIQKGWILIRAPFSVENDKEPKSKLQIIKAADAKCVDIIKA